MSSIHDPRDRRYQRDRTGLTNPRIEDMQVGINSSEAPPPGEESVGPTMFDMVVELRRAREVSSFLLKQAETLLAKRTIIVKNTGQTDGSGNLELPIYQVPNGYQFYVTRWTVEAVGFDPSTPYTNAAGDLYIFAGQRYGFGSMLDFLPNPPAASGPILPASVAPGKDAGLLVRGGEWVSLKLATGPVNTDIYARIQGLQEVI